MDWIKEHLKRPGPAFGKCPSGYTMRRVLVIPGDDEYKFNKCCCESDTFPLGLSFPGN